MRALGSLSELTRAESDKSKVGTVHLKDGTSFPADVVLLAVGVKPRTEYLADHVDLNKDGSVNVDKHFAVEGLSDVFAIGDIAKCAALPAVIADLAATSTPTRISATVSSTGTSRRATAACWRRT